MCNFHFDYYFLKLLLQITLYTHSY